MTQKKVSNSFLHLVISDLFPRGVYLNVTCDLPIRAVPSLLEEYSRDTDILKKAFVGTVR